MNRISTNLKDKKYEFVMTGGALDYFISLETNKNNSKNSSLESVENIK